MNYGDLSGTNSTNFTATGLAEMAKTEQQSPTQEQAEYLEKTLNHLAGRVVELKARMERVLLPRVPEGPSDADVKQPERARSPNGDRLHVMRALAQDAIHEIEDILNRLDV